MKRTALLFTLVFSLALVCNAQFATVTNSTLERFQQKRLAAERDYRENYARMGFPSPEELEQQREADMEARIELSDQLRQARLEAERINLQRQSLELQASETVENVPEAPYNPSYNGVYLGEYGGYYSNRRFRRYNNYPFGGYYFPRRRLGTGPLTGPSRITPVGSYPTTRPGRFIRRR